LFGMRINIRYPKNTTVLLSCQRFFSVQKKESWRRRAKSPESR
jgi:hypothetical protein